MYMYRSHEDQYKLLNNHLTTHIQLFKDDPVPFTIIILYVHVTSISTHTLSSLCLSVSPQYGLNELKLRFRTRLSKHLYARYMK